MSNIKFSFIVLAVVGLGGCQTVVQPKLTVGSTGLSEPPAADAQVRAERINFKKLKY